MKTNFFRMKLLGLFEEWCKLADADRRRNFLHNSLWVGLLPAAAVGFGVTFLIGLAGGEDSLERILRYACLSGGLNAFSWTTGIWAAVGPSSEERRVGKECRL